MLRLGTNPSIVSVRYLIATGLSCMALTAAVRAQSYINGWGNGYVIDNRLAVDLTYVEIDGGGNHCVARRSDGSVVAWGSNYYYGQCNVPSLPPGLTYVEIAAGSVHNLARRSDGSVVGWGDNAYAQNIVPPLPPGITYVEVAAGGGHSLARRSDGSVIAWGNNAAGQCNVPPLPPGLA